VVKTKSVFQNGFANVLLMTVAVLALANCAKPVGLTTDAMKSEPIVTKDAATQASLVTLSEETDLRRNQKDVLETAVKLPAGTVIQVPADYEVQHLNYRDANGDVQWSSTGFITPVQIVSVAGQNSNALSQTQIDELNRTPGGLFVFDSIIGAIEGVSGSFAAVYGASDGTAFEANYEHSGRPKHNFTKKLKSIYGVKLNAGKDPAHQTLEERTKWQAIFAELKRAADRTVETEKSIIMMIQSAAILKSINYEKLGTISPFGAWSIATLGTATRHGFSATPCAEFMSEMIREAYQRAGYRVADDFNKQKGNQLIYSNTAAVSRLGPALAVAGWVPWDASVYRPPTGAVVMNNYGQTPGHTYMAAGDDGRTIIDNGSPQGRDLRKTIAKTMNSMFQSGLFFLPPGVNPKSW